MGWAERKLLQGHVQYVYRSPVCGGDDGRRPAGAMLVEGFGNCHTFYDTGSCSVEFSYGNVWHSVAGESQTGNTGQPGFDDDGNVPEMASGWEPLQDVPDPGIGFGTAAGRCDEYLQPVS